VYADALQQNKQDKSFYDYPQHVLKAIVIAGVAQTRNLLFINILSDRRFLLSQE
jgi:hypothetical protein